MLAFTCKHYERCMQWQQESSTSPYLASCEACSSFLPTVSVLDYQNQEAYVTAERDTQMLDDSPFHVMPVQIPKQTLLGLDS